VIADAGRFIAEPERKLAIWSPQYFHDLTKTLKLDADKAST